MLWAGALVESPGRKCCECWVNIFRGRISDCVWRSCMRCWLAFYRQVDLFISGNHSEAVGLAVLWRCSGYILFGNSWCDG